MLDTCSFCGWMWLLHALCATVSRSTASISPCPPSLPCQGPQYRPLLAHTHTNVLKRCMHKEDAYFEVRISGAGFAACFDNQGWVVRPFAQTNALMIQTICVFYVKLSPSRGSFLRVEVGEVSWGLWALHCPLPGYLLPPQCILTCTFIFKMLRNRGRSGFVSKSLS